MGTIRKKSFDLLGHYTSVSLEEEFWAAFQEIAQERGYSLRKLVLEIDDARVKTLGDAKREDLQETRAKPLNLSSSIRVYILQYYRCKLGK